MGEEVSDGVSLELEYLNGLKFFDEHWHYQGRDYPYAAVSGIDYYAVRTRHSVNFVPTGTSHDAYLTVEFEDRSRVSVRQEYAYFGSSQKKRAEAVMRASEILSEMTFTARYERYEKALNDKKHAVFSGYQFHRDGDVFKKNAHLCNLRDKDVGKRLTVFDFVFDYPGIGWHGFRKRFTHQVSLRINRDCFLRFFNDTYGLAWSGERLRSKRRRVSEADFQSAVLKLCARLAKIDGRITVDEIVRVRHYFGITEQSLPGSAEIFREFARNDVSVKVLATELRDLFTGNSEALDAVMRGLVQVAAADGHLHAAEVAFLLEVGGVFGIPDTESSAMLEALGMGYASGAARRGDSGLAVYYHLLGLKPGASLAAVKVAYWQKAKAHHPDVLRGMGAGLDKIKESEVILVRINEAYAILSKRLAN